MIVSASAGPHRGWCTAQLRVGRPEGVVFNKEQGKPQMGEGEAEGSVG